jgi:aminoglycoside 2'-N-acetyltransferase I
MIARMEVRTAHTADLSPPELAAVHALLDAAFEGQLDAHDHEHALGGVHALVWEDGELVAHGSVVMRRLLHGGRALRTGYVEGVGVRADRRGQGHGTGLMAALENVLRGAYELGALSSSEEAVSFYAARGWQLWQGPTSAITPTGVVRTEDEDGGIFVFPLRARLDLAAGLACDWRDGEVW